MYWDSFLALVNLPVNDFLSPGKETTHVSFPLLFLWNQNVDKQFLFLEHAEEFQEPNSTIQWFIQTNLLSLPPPYIITTTNFKINHGNVIGNRRMNMKVIPSLRVPYSWKEFNLDVTLLIDQISNQLLPFMLTSDSEGTIER